MAKSILDIVIRTIKEGTGDKQLVQGLTSVKGTITTAVTAFAALAGAAYVVDKALDATVGATVRYAEQIREVQHATGANAEEASRLVQFTEDAKISYETFTKAMAKAVREGVTPNIEGLAQLSDEYLKLQPGAERGAFLLDKFGRSGLEMAELMEKGGAGIREFSAGIDDSLILTQEAVDNAREYERAVDALGEQWDKFAFRVGANALPALTQLIEGMNEYLDLAKHEEETYTRAAINRNAVEAAMRREAETSERLKDDLYEQAAAQAIAGQAASDAAVNYSALVGMMQQLNNATALEIKQAAFRQLQNDLQKSGNELTAEEAKLLQAAGIELGIFDKKSANTANSIMALNGQLQDGTIDLDTYRAALEALPERVEVEIVQNYVTSGQPVTPQTTVPTPQAIGGSQTAGQPYLVHQDEIIVPAQNGYTLTRTDAQAILRESLRGSKGGRNLTIHGGISIVVQQGSVLDVLEELGA